MYSYWCSEDSIQCQLTAVSDKHGKIQNGNGECVKEITNNQS